MQPISRIAIVGVGLIGASFARAVRQAWPQVQFSAFDSDASALTSAVAQGIVDSAEASVELAVRDADLVLIATPVRSIAGHVRKAAAAAPSAVITDSGSVKQSIIDALHATGGPLANFVPAHPVAGSERFGVNAADAELFRGRRVVLTPPSGTNADAIAMVRAAWEATGATVEHMQAQHHDEVLAATSHLPHVLAYALVDCLAAMDDRREIFSYAAGGFRDFTRIASSSPEMWRDILLENRDHLLHVLDAFEGALGPLRKALERSDDATVLATLMRARAARQRFLELVEQPGREH